MPMKTFSTSEPSSDRLKIVDFELDGEKLSARRPKTAAFLALADTQDSQNPIDQVRAVKVFMDECLVPDSRDHIQDRLDDPDDEFDLDDIVPIINWLIEELSTTSRPTGRPTASSGRPKRTGSRSTARSRAPVSTPANSTSTDS